MLLNFDNLVRKYNVDAKGVLHLGASEGQEAESYSRHGYKMAFVEALPNIYRKLVDNVRDLNAVTYQECVSDIDGQDIEFNIANNAGQSSSMLDFGTHTREHPEVKFIGKIRLKTKRVDSFVENLDQYQILVMDLQGAELMALKGIGQSLTNFKYIYTEVNWKHVYKGCALIDEMDDYLASFGFKRVETFRMPRCNWGDAFYIKEQPKPVDKSIFKPKHPVNYPPHNKNDFEWWFLNNYKPEPGELEYIPVTWTAYQLKFDKNKEMVNRLQSYLNSLDLSKKYFTVVQHDDGIKFNLPPDCRVFGMGKESDYPLPLICEPHRFEFNNDRDIQVSYIGNNTHPIRAMIKPKPGWYISRKHHNEREFCEILSRSVFTLCPRGYGITSFRIMEALQYGSIPIYISDRFIFPHNVDFESYGIIIKSEQISSISEILQGVNVEEKQSRIPEVYEKYFTYEANMKLIKDEIRQ